MLVVLGGGMGWVDDELTFPKKKYFGKLNSFLKFLHFIELGTAVFPNLLNF